MYALDFQYDDRYLSDYGFMICDFNGQNGANYVNAGSQITFEKVKRNNGSKYSLVSTQYNECITAEFDICKNPEEYDKLEITNDEYRDIMRWLNRKEYLKFHVVPDNSYEHETCYYMASFTIKKIFVGEKLYGIHLSMETNSPFGFGAERRYCWEVIDTSQTYRIDDYSDEVGDTYVNVKVKCSDDGDLLITNTSNDTITRIDNCVNNETIIIDGDSKLITTDKEHSVMNDFNYQFFKITNTLSSKKNIITFSLPCIAIITYTPIIKDTPH